MPTFPGHDSWTPPTGRTSETFTCDLVRHFGTSQGRKDYSFASSGESQTQFVYCSVRTRGAPWRPGPNPAGGGARGASATYAVLGIFSGGRTPLVGVLGVALKSPKSVFAKFVDSKNAG